MPGFFGIACSRSTIRNSVYPQISAFEVFGHGHKILGSCNHCPVARIFSPAIGIKAIVGFVVQRPQPVDILRMSPVAFGIYPGTIFHTHNSIGRHRMIFQKLLDSSGFVAGISSSVCKTVHCLIIITAASSPGIIAIVSQQ